MAGEAKNILELLTKLYTGDADLMLKVNGCYYPLDAIRTAFNIEQNDYQFGSLGMEVDLKLAIFDSQKLVEPETIGIDPREFLPKEETKQEKSQCATRRVVRRKQPKQAEN